MAALLSRSKKVAIPCPDGSKHIFYFSVLNIILLISLNKSLHLLSSKLRVMLRRKKEIMSAQNRYWDHPAGK